MTSDNVSDNMSDARERLAALEHEQWMAWAKTLMEKESLSPERVARWKLLCVPYDQLAAEHKNQDRAWADKVLAIVCPSFSFSMPRRCAPCWHRHSKDCGKYGDFCHRCGSADELT